MIMVLCLSAYAMTEFQLRRNLQKIGGTVAGQTKTQTHYLTLKGPFFRFHGVQELWFWTEEAVTVIVMNMTWNCGEYSACLKRNMKIISYEKRPAEYGIRNTARGATPLNGSSVGLRRLRKLFHATRDINTHS